MIINAIFMLKDYQKELNSEYAKKAANLLVEEGFRVLALGRTGISVSIDSADFIKFIGQEVFRPESSVLEIPEEKTKLHAQLSKLIIPSKIEHY